MGQRASPQTVRPCADTHATASAKALDLACSQRPPVVSNCAWQRGLKPSTKRCWDGAPLANLGGLLKTPMEPDD